MKTVNLHYPVIRKSGAKETEISSIYIRRPKLKDFQGLDLGNAETSMAHMVILICRISNLTQEEAADIDIVDYQSMTKAIGEMIKSIVE